MQIKGHSRKDAAASWQPFRASGRLTDSNMERLQRSKLFAEQPTQTVLMGLAVNILPIVVVIGLLYFLFVRQLKQAGRGEIGRAHV